MRHGKTVNHLGRTSSHRKAMLSNMATSLIMHKRIKTTVAKAKALRVYVEPLLTKAKSDNTNNRRVVFSYLQNKEAINALFNEVADKIANRPGGYTRIVRIDNRAGDNAEMAIIELVDYNDVYVKEAKAGGAKKRTRRGASKVKAEAAPAAEVTEAEPATETPEAPETPETSSEENNEEKAAE